MLYRYTLGQGKVFMIAGKSVVHADLSFCTGGQSTAPLLYRKSGAGVISTGVEFTLANWNLNFHSTCNQALAGITT